FRALLQAQGFVDIEIEPTRVYDASAARTFLEQAGLPVEEHLAALEGRVMAAFVRATRPAAA
nr:arsenite S-adenosylmethyltransferase [Gemmatimonadaceae bacterium]